METCDSISLIQLVLLNTTKLRGSVMFQLTGSREGTNSSFPGIPAPHHGWGQVLIVTLGFSLHPGGAPRS